MKAAIALTFMMWSLVAFCQRGTAPAGYYPPGYAMDTFSGKVTAVDKTTEVITISFDNGKKTETFTGHLLKPCDVPSATKNAMTASDLAIGTEVTAFFEPKTHKDGGTKVNENFIIGMIFRSWGGHPLKEPTKMYPCF